MRADTHTTDTDDLLWESETLQVHTCSVSSMDNNVYVVTCRSSGRRALVDAADDMPRIAALLRNASREDDDRELASIVTTHRHADHHMALVDAVAATGAATYAGALDADHVPVTPHVRLEHGDSISIGEVEVEVISLRGHTPGSIALALKGGDPADTTLLLTGDSLFPGGPGMTTSPADFSSLMDDLTERIFARFDDATLVLPGHGDGTTLGRERPHLEVWRQRGW